jgi:ligand-binding sensor domain-containing protein/predicted transcriptional regulator
MYLNFNTMKKLIFLFQALLLSFSAFGIDLSRIKFEYLSVDDGLSQGTIEDILQDKEGMMWFATRDGLNRYDGQKFTVFRNSTKDTNSLASNWVLSLAIDPSGKLWIGSAGGLNVYDPKLDKITRIQTNVKDARSFKGGQVYDINVDFDSTLWISTTNGLVHYFPAEHNFITYSHDPKKASSLPVNVIFNTLITKNGKLFVAGDTDPIFEFNRKDESFTPINYKKDYLGANSRKSIQEDQKGLLYIVSENGALHIYNPVTAAIQLITAEAGGLNAISIKTKVLFVSSHEVWIGTDGGGINIFDPISGKMDYLMPDNRNSTSLNNKAVFKLYQDKDQNIWVGQYNTGISVWKRNKEKFVSYRNNPFNPKTLNKEVVCGIFEDSEGRIWIGQDGGGLDLFHPDDQTFEHFRHEDGNPQSLTTDVILAINEDPDGNLLLGTYAGGLMIFDPVRKKVIKAFGTADGLPCLNIWTIFKDSKSRYWMAFLHAGAGLYNPADRSFIYYTPGDSLHPVHSKDIMHITEDRKGRIWFGSENAGLAILDEAKGTLRTYVHNEKNINSISNNDIKSILFTDKYAWIATNGGGLNRLDLKTDSFKVFNMGSGLSSDALMSMLTDKQGNFWISSTRGLMKFNPEKFTIETYDKSQGLQGTEFRYNSQWRLSDGSMMFGGVNGLTVFNPDSIKNSKIRASVIFTDLKIFSESVIPGGKGSPLKYHINFTDHFQLRHNQSVFTLEFAAIDYNSPKKNLYRYKMEGFDDKWIEAGNRNFVTYTNLDPGKYTFLLQGSNSDGVWNETPRKISIRIRPPWYKTLVAITLFILILGYMIYAYLRERIIRSNQDKKTLQLKIDEGQALLDIKVRELEKQQKELQLRDGMEKDTRFLMEGISKMSDIIAKKRRNLEDLATGYISELVRYVNASAGDVYIVDYSDPTQSKILATGEFAFSTSHERKYEIMSGEGYVGSCFKDKKTLVMDNLPDDYVILRSGLGEISLHHLILVPLLQDDVCVGVIEVASIDKLDDHKVRFIEKVSESLASVVAIIKANEKSNMMLEQNEVQAEELRAQEEEMRQNMEELLATQESSQKRIKEIEDELQLKINELNYLQEEITLLKSKKADA